MKKFIAILSAVLFSVTTAFANTASTADNNNTSISTVRGYGNSFIFVEEGIEFSVFPDGQFDFYMQNYGPNVNVGVSSRNFAFSFNSGYDYGPYVQYDEFGAVIQVEHIPVYYDWYGRVSRIGNVRIHYNNWGRVNRVGGLYVHYSGRIFSHCTGFINIYNRSYVYRPWHSYYRIPAYNHCVIYNRPYRQHYTPVRYRYTRPYRNNYRRTTAVANRRGNTITRRRDYATVRNNSTSRRNNTVRNNNTPRRNNSTVRNNSSRRNNATRDNTPTRRSTVASNTPRTRTNTKTRINTSKKRTVTPRTSTVRQRSSAPKRQTVQKRSTVQKPNSSANRTISRTNSNRSRQTASKASRSKTSSKARRSGRR